MFDAIPIDIKRLILLRFIENNRDFLNIALSCKSWNNACCDVKYPVKSARLQLDGKASKFNINGRYTYTANFIQTASDVVHWTNTDLSIVHTYADSNSQICAIEFAAKFLAEHRVGRMTFFMCNTLDTAFEPILKEQHQRSRCTELVIRNANANTAQIRAICELIQANSYKMESYKKSVEWLIWNKHMLKATGRFEVSGFGWDPQFYDLKCSTVEFKYRERCGLTIYDIKKWAKIWRTESSFLEELKITDIACTNDEALEIFSEFERGTIKSIRRIVESTGEIPQLWGATSYQQIAGKFLIFGFKRTEVGNIYFDLKLSCIDCMPKS